MSSADELRELLRSTNFRTAAGEAHTPIRNSRDSGARHRDRDRGAVGGEGNSRSSVDSSTEELAALLSTLDTTLKTPLKGANVGGGSGASRHAVTGNAAGSGLIGTTGAGARAGAGAGARAGAAGGGGRDSHHPSTYPSTSFLSGVSGVSNSNTDRLTALSAANTSASAVAAKVRANMEYSGMSMGAGGLSTDPEDTDTRIRGHSSSAGAGRGGGGGGGGGEGSWGLPPAAPASASTSAPLYEIDSYHLPGPPGPPAAVGHSRDGSHNNSNNSNNNNNNNNNNKKNNNSESGSNSNSNGLGSSAQQQAGLPADTYDATVLHYHTEVSMRTKLGKYLTALPVSAHTTAGSSSSSSSSSGTGGRYNPGGDVHRGVADGTSAGAGATFFGHLAAAAAGSAATSISGMSSEYVLGIEGQGIGDPLDCFTIIPTSSVGPSPSTNGSVNNNSSSGSRSSSGGNVASLDTSLDKLNNAGSLPLRYGMTVAIRAPSARERYLGLHKSSQKGIGFWRALVGTAEHWTLIKGRHTGHYVGAGSGGSGSGGSGGILEEAGSRGSYVRQGDSILLFAGSVNGIVNHSNLRQHLDNHLHTLPSQTITIHEGVDGCEARLVHHERHSGIGNEFFQINAFGAQPLPAWTDRPYLTQGFLLQRPAITRDTVLRVFPTANDADVASTTAGTSSAGGVASSTSVQHSSLVRELLSALAGIEGQYIHISASAATSCASNAGSNSSSAKPILKDVEFMLAASISNDHAFASQIQLLLPLCSQAVIIRDFLRLHARPSYGLVSHALASAMRVIFREYDILIAQLEYQYKTGQLSLQRLVFLIQPSVKILALFAHISARCWDKMGGSLLDELQHLLLEQGDSRNKELVLHLFQHASRPFLYMVSSWIFRGELDDPYKEFMIQEDVTVVRDSRMGLDGYSTNYWDNRLLLVHPHIPKILRTVAPRILTAGKYLNVVRGCIEKGNTGALGSNTLDPAAARAGAVSLSSHLPQIQELSLDAEGSATALITIVEQSYIYSSRSLLRLLQYGHHLTTHLHSLSRFFLLDHGDFFIQFIGTCPNPPHRVLAAVCYIDLYDNLFCFILTQLLFFFYPHTQILRKVS